MAVSRFASGGTYRSLIALILLSFCLAEEENPILVGVPASVAAPSPSPPSSTLSRRYLLYDVNPGEGFNLRRDVYLRVANLVSLLNSDESGHSKWTLVLPPWGPLYHWRSDEVMQTALPWSVFFDLASLRRHVPVIELRDWLQAEGAPAIDELYYLQSYAEGWGGKWEEKYNIRPCIGKTGFWQGNDGLWHGWFWDHDEMHAFKFECLSAQAEYATLKNFLLVNTTGRTIMLHRSEVMIHGKYSEWSPEWWRARRSMRFAKHLTNAADRYRQLFLSSNDKDDRTMLEDNWTTAKTSVRNASGGPYVAVHLRRQDFLLGRSSQVPSLRGAAGQLRALLDRLRLLDLYVATDAPDEEFRELQSYLGNYHLHRFHYTEEDLESYKDGGLAIIDQWICAHARHFVGTHHSTFSFRIQEERELLGFKPETTFNRLCGDAEPEASCRDEQPTRWLVKYG